MGCGDNIFGNMIPVTGGYTTQKEVILVEGPGIAIQDQSDATKYKFRISTTVIETLSVTLTLVAKAASVTKTNPILQGTVIDELNLSWVYNNPIVSQTLTSPLADPILTEVEVDYDYTGQNITTGISLTIQGNDGLAQPGSIASDTKSITFGNYMYIGVGASQILEAYSGLEAFIEAMTPEIKTTRNKTFYPTADQYEYQFVAYPKAWGLGTFQKNVGPGGFLRLKKVGPILKAELGIGDVETDIMITNSAGHTEAYYVYQSEQDWISDNVTPTTLS